MGVYLVYFCQMFYCSLQKFDRMCQSRSLLDQLWHLKFPVGLEIIIFLRDGAARIWKYLHWVGLHFCTGVCRKLCTYCLWLTYIAQLERYEKVKKSLPCKAFTMKWCAKTLAYQLLLVNKSFDQPKKYINCTAKGKN